MKILTFNIWFSPMEMRMRMRAIGDIIAAHDPDIVALQEVTALHWRELARHDCLSEFHWFTEPAADARYFTVLGSRREMHGPQRVPFRSSASASTMGRDLVHAAIDEAPFPVIAATTHLESLSRAGIRAAQLEESLRALDARSAGRVDVVFCGDTNIMPDEMVTLPPGWIDAWDELQKKKRQTRRRAARLMSTSDSTTTSSSAPSSFTTPTKRSAGEAGGFTFDVARNKMVQREDAWASQHHMRARLDRFYVKLIHYSLKAIELVGTEPIDARNLWWPSDHFGLLLHLEENRRPAGTME